MMQERDAAVALVLSSAAGGDEILVVRRATFAGDPWSGHIALPGGRFDAADESLEQTARRETMEETGIDLSASTCIARLADVTPQSQRAPAVRVAPFVFRYDGARIIRLSEEIAEAWWIPVADLARTEAWRTASVVISEGSTMEARGFDVYGYTLWGLTERIVALFLRTISAP
ncbi:MAG: CoA pyrophosphatase [Gemmatimonadota bacterium]|nr:CoA pyrophosphatase [Gemmatimonadota bacterium]